VNHIFYEPAGLFLWKTWHGNQTEENQNNLIMYTCPLIRAIIYSNPHLYPERSIYFNRSEAFNELVISAIQMLPKFNPERGTLHGFFSFKLFKALWDYCHSLEKQGMKGLPKKFDSENLFMDDMVELEGHNHAELEIFIEHLLKNADLTFFEIHTYNNLLGLIRTNPAKLVSNPVSVLHEVSGLSFSLVKSALVNLRIYYYYSERVKC